METALYDLNQDDVAQSIARCGQIIRDGGTVVFPTETVYGLGANAFDPAAVAKIFEAKGRPADNPLIVHIADWDQISELVAEVPEKARQLAAAYWPGPMTMIMRRSAAVPDAVTAGLETVGIRFHSYYNPHNN